MSGEHIFSEALFSERTVHVFGSKFRTDALKEIGIDALKSNILCKHHNETLSPIDTVGGEAFAALKKARAAQRADKRIVNKKRIAYSVNALLWERWFVKTLINCTYRDGLPIGVYSHMVGEPCESLVKVAFGLDTLRRPAGLYGVKKNIVSGTGKNVITEPITKDGQCVAGMFFELCGAQFVLWLNHNELPSKGKLTISEGWSREGWLFHPPYITIGPGQVREHRIVFVW